MQSTLTEEGTSAYYPIPLPVIPFKASHLVTRKNPRPITENSVTIPRKINPTRVSSPPYRHPNTHQFSRSFPFRERGVPLFESETKPSVGFPCLVSTGAEYDVVICSVRGFFGWVGGLWSCGFGLLFFFSRFLNLGWSLEELRFAVLQTCNRTVQ